MLDKRKVIEEIRHYLEGELVSADEARAHEIQAQLLMYRFLPVREYAREDVIVPSALVELRIERTTMYCLVVPQGGGLITRVQGQAVQVVTPQSPLGEALLGHRTGDRVRVDLRGGTREYEIVSVT